MKILLLMLEKRADVEFKIEEGNLKYIYLFFFIRV